ncbi:MAG: hypothetical protein AD742_02215 [Methylibium sp. NZG]|nr:MAG: hypothetical protein AD742_02215 [Methylibium sp. NZG]
MSNTPRGDDDVPTDLERLDEADACHDDDPTRSADLLRTIDPAQLPPHRWPGLAYLLNHVLGEKLNRWDEALHLQQRLISAAQPEPALVLWRQVGTAALLAGDTPRADEYTAALAHASGAPAARCADLLQLNAATFRVPGLHTGPAADVALAALAPLAQPGWQADSPLDASVAACANNLANALLEQPVAALRQGPARAALTAAAEQAQRFWQRAGTWVQCERALYLCAMVSNVLGEAAAARAHALAALALIDANTGNRAADPAEDVDRAFIELERWHACAQAGLAGEAAEARRNADALAARFDDDGLTAWFAQRVQALAALSPAQ